MADLESQVKRINGYDIMTGSHLCIQYAYGQPRVVNEKFDRNVSPRLSKPKLYEWLGGFEEALQLMNEKRFDNGKGE